MLKTKGTKIKIDYGCEDNRFEEVNYEGTLEEFKKYLNEEYDLRRNAKLEVIEKDAEMYLGESYNVDDLSTLYKIRERVYKFNRRPRHMREEYTELFTLEDIEKKFKDGWVIYILGNDYRFIEVDEELLEILKR